jgi:glutathione S-transferase
VPTIDDDGYVLWESNTIVRYLASRHGPGTLCPTEAQARFLAERWMDWQLSTAVPLGMVYRGLIRTPPEKRDNNAIAAAQKASADAMTILDNHLAGRDFMEAGRLTIGDITTGVMAYRWFGLGNPKEAMPNLGRYYERLTERAAYREHVMLPLT